MINFDELLAVLQSHGWLGIITLVVVGIIVVTFLFWLFRQWWGLANGK